MRMNRRWVVVAMLLCVGQSLPAGAVENRFNVHAELGPNLMLDQPAFTGTDKENLVTTAGMHLRFSFEYALSEWIGLQAGWEPDLLFSQFESRITSRQGVALGVRLRPWWSRSNEYLLQRKGDKKLWIGDALSYVWVDANAGIAGGNGTRFGFDVGVGTRVPLVSPVQVGLFVCVALLWLSV